MFQKIKILKQLHLIISMILFISLIIYSLYTQPLHLSEISLSRFGVSKNGFIWNLGLCLVSFFLYFNIERTISNFIKSDILNILTIFASMHLCLNGLIDMHYWLHNFVAIIYFMLISIIIFLFGLKLHKTNFRIAQLSIFLSILSLLIPILLVSVIKSLAIPELSHIAILFTWLIALNNDKEIIKIIKYFGF